MVQLTTRLGHLIDASLATATPPGTWCLAHSRRGWLEATPAPGAYAVAPEGRAAREVVERLTDSYFYAPWECMADREIAELYEALIRLMTQLRERVTG
ncbi:MAG TPA: hypothetical protein VFU22_16900 [Roseiflexaceae bacterium]|nr:hypothetical protein [Roseiflexaceae bacterium]